MLKRHPPAGPEGGPGWLRGAVVVRGRPGPRERRRGPGRGAEGVGHEVGPLMNGICALIKETSGSSLVPSAMWGHRKKVIIMTKTRALVR